MPKIPRLPFHSPHGVLRSPECFLYPSIFSFLPSPLYPQRINLLLPPPALTNTAVFLSLRPICRRNIFYSIPHLCPWCRLPPSGLMAPLPSILPRLIFIHLVYWTQLHPLHYRGLPKVDILPHSMCSCFPENNRRTLHLPRPIPLPLVFIPRDLPEEAHMDSLQPLYRRRLEHPCF